MENRKSVSNKANHLLTIVTSGVLVLIVCLTVYLFGKKFRPLFHNWFVISLVVILLFVAIATFVNQTANIAVALSEGGATKLTAVSTAVIVFASAFRLVVLTRTGPAHLLTNSNAVKLAIILIIEVATVFAAIFAYRVIKTANDEMNRISGSALTSGFASALAIMSVLDAVVGYR